MTVLIGVDPHKGSHTAVAIGSDEAVIDELRVVATVGQVDELLGWAKPLGERTWAVESAGGLGYLLSQQLVAAGKTVLDVPATLAARVRVLGIRPLPRSIPPSTHQGRALRGRLTRHQTTSLAEDPLHGLAARPYRDAAASGVRGRQIERNLGHRVG